MLPVLCWDPKDVVAGAPSVCKVQGEPESRIESRRVWYRTRLRVVLVLHNEMSLNNEFAYVHCGIASV